MRPRRHTRPRHSLGGGWRLSLAGQLLTVHEQGGETAGVDEGHGFLAGDMAPPDLVDHGRMVEVPAESNLPEAEWPGQ